MSKGAKIAAALVVVVAVGAFVGIRFKAPESVPEAVAPPVVRVRQPETGDIELFRGMTGTVEASDSVYVIPKAAGEITAVYVKNGDYVTEDFLNYVRPLIQGDVPPIMVDGIPRHLYHCDRW